MADEVLRRLVRRVEQLRVGDPLDKNTDVGAINSAAQLLRIRELTAFGESEGATRYTIRVSCLKRATGSPRRSSPTWRSPTGSRAKRSSVHALVLTFRTPEERRQGEQHELRTRVRHMEREGEPDALVAERLRAAHLANTYNRFDPTSPLRHARVGFGREVPARTGAYLNV